jgi:hypothetical protein
MVLSAGTWHFNNLTAATGSPVIGSEELLDGPALDAYAFEGQGTQHVVYGSFPRIHELWWDSTGWHANELTVTAGNAPPESESGALQAYAFEAQGTQHVFYASTELHMIELRWASDRWSWTDLSELTGAPANLLPFTAYAFESKGIQNVVYFTVPDDAFRELWQDANAWHSDNGNLGITGRLPFGYVIEADGTQHIAYVGPSDHVLEVWWGDAQNFIEDAAQVAGAPDAASGVTGHVIDGLGHLFYVGTTGAHPGARQGPGRMGLERPHELGRGTAGLRSLPARLRYLPDAGELRRRRRSACVLRWRPGRPYSRAAVGGAGGLAMERPFIGHRIARPRTNRRPDRRLCLQGRGDPARRLRGSGRQHPRAVVAKRPHAGPSSDSGRGLNRSGRDQWVVRHSRGPPSRDLTRSGRPGRGP